MNPVISGIFQQFPALGHKHYRGFFIAQFVSVTGMWMQQVTIPWLVYDQTGSKFMLGLVTALSLLPTLLFTIFAGVFADRRAKKTILILAQSLFLLNALMFAALSWLGALTLLPIIFLGMMRGFILAFEIPTRQAFFREMVDLRSLPSAIALNSSLVNAARFVGPAIAGIILAKIGATACFAINAVTFLGIIFVLFWIRPVRVASSGEGSGLARLAAGFRLAARSVGIRSVLLLVGVCSLFGWTYITLLPAIARSTFGVREDGYGLLFSVSGLGALVGAVLPVVLARRVPLPKFIVAGWLAFITALVCFALSPTYGIGLAMIFCIGLGLSTLHVAGNSLVQTLVPDEYRGRIMGLYAFLFIGLAPLGSLLVGTVAQWLGSTAALIINASVCLIAILLLRSPVLNCRHPLRPATEARDIHAGS